MTYSCHCDYEMATISRARAVKHARRSRRCGECGITIHIGDPYVSTFGVWEGYPETHRECRACADLREWAIISVPCFCWLYGQLHEAVAEMVSEVRRDIPGFAFEAGRRAIKIRQQLRRQRSERRAA